MPGDTEFRDLGDKDAYEVLGVPRDATQQQIQHEYRLLMEIWHPDNKRPGSEARDLAEARAKELNVARMYLTESRKTYDAFLARRDRGNRTAARRAEHPGGPAAPSDLGAPVHPGATQQTRDPWDDFAPGGPGAARTKPPRPQAPPGPIWRSRPGQASARYGRTAGTRPSGWRTTGRFFAGLLIALVIWLICTSSFFIIFDAAEGSRAHHPGVRLTLFAIGCNLIILIGSVAAPLVMFRRRRKRRAAAG